ncbi:MAG: cupin domain-containing protein [Methylotenera sp.]
MNKPTDTPLRLLNNLTASQFLAEYWQKKPLLIRSAIPDFKGLLNPNELAGLACEDDVQSRIIRHSKGKWQVENGPFDEADFTQLPARDWTLLVQSVNHHLPEAAGLLSQFNFIPHTRLDDLMVSYAPDGGGVGPHIDSYDVFLLQGSGQRRWKISGTNNKNPADLSLIENAPLKILKHFETEQEWVLEAGDMLYLPPQIAHWGTAVGDDCMTYSIGFRAPKTQELMHEFLNYLQDNIQAEGLYTDPDLSVQEHPAEIKSEMIDKVSGMLQTITWDKNSVADFLGKYLTEPKPDMVFEPARKISQTEFIKKLSKKSLLLNLKSQLLFTQNNFYLNGEKLIVAAELIGCMQDLADNRICETPALQANIHAALGNALLEAYLAGFVCFNHE